ncbi:MAG: hypothetical protein WCR04_10150 [Fibrobacteraceae bacterium]
MNKLIVLLVALVLLFWGVFIYRLTLHVPIDKGMGAELDASAPSSASDISKWFVPDFKLPSNVRDPFRLPQALRVSPKTAPPKIIEAASSASMPRPDITLDAILPGDNPVAILKHHGESSVVRVGDEVWGVRVVSITAASVTLGYSGGSFELRP